MPERELVAEFTVHGVAKTAGSKKGFVNPQNGRVIIKDDSGEGGKAWRSDVKDAALAHFVDEDTGEVHPLEGAIHVEIIFYRHRPKGHFGAGRQTRNIVKDTAPAVPTTRPDVDKTSRAILDALKGTAWLDDAQVTRKIVEKRYAEADFTRIRIIRPAEQLARDLPMEERVRGESWGERAVGQASLIAA